MDSIREATAITLFCNIGKVNNTKALKFFNSIKTDYPKSSEADLIDIKIEQAK